MKWAYIRQNLEATHRCPEHKRTPRAVFYEGLDAYQAKRRFIRDYDVEERVVTNLSYDYACGSSLGHASKMPHDELCRWGDEPLDAWLLRMLDLGVVFVPFKEELDGES